MSNPMLAPEVSASVTGRVPKYLYTARATKVKAQQEKAPKGYMRTVLACEICAPDVVEDVSSPDKPKYAVAGRKFSLYLPTDPISKQYSDSYAAFTNLGYKNPDGSINLEKFWQDAEAGALFFYVELNSSEDVVKDGAGQPILHPLTGQRITKGWQIDFVQPNNILGRADTGSPNPTVPAGNPY